MNMTSVDFVVGEHKVNITKVKGIPDPYTMWYHCNDTCKRYPNQHSLKSAIAEARRILREKNHA